MALDNAQFISELSIVDPPGTDPLSQGDDQIRTIKRATQQSFPNISEAMTLTAVQLNLAAIKNEINEFTARQDLLDSSLRFEASTDRGLQWTNGGDLRWQQLIRLSGTNNFDWVRYDVLGVIIGTAMSLKWDTGILDFTAGVPTIQGAPIWVAGELRIFVANTTPGTNWFVADGTNGTVNLDDRVLVAEGASAAGTNLAPNLVGITAGTGVTDATAINESQMPAHAHRLKIADDGTIESLGLSRSNQVIFGSRDNVVNKRFSLTAGGGELLIENTGTTQGHTHGQNSVAVTENGADRNTVRPLSRTVQYHQYVP